MVFQYEKEGPKTGLEKKYDEVKSTNSNIDSSLSQVVNNQVFDNVQSKLNPDIKPNKYFIEEAKKRQAEERNVIEKEKFLDTIDETGNKLEKIYNAEGFKAMHDPLNLYSNKPENKLAWKVFYDVEDRDVYLRTLYYPNLRSDDYANLTSVFSQEYSAMLTKRKLNGIISLLAGSAGAAISYRYSFKSRIGVIFSMALFGTTFYGIDSIFRSRMKDNLNKYAKEIADKYSEIKYTNVEYGKVNH